jgi:hypothetical protein
MSDTAKNSGTPGVLTLLLFVIYALLLVGVILFKFPSRLRLRGPSPTVRQLVIHAVATVGASITSRRIDKAIAAAAVARRVARGAVTTSVRGRWSYGVFSFVAHARACDDGCRDRK